MLTASSSRLLTNKPAALPKQPPPAPRLRAAQLKVQITVDGEPLDWANLKRNFVQDQAKYENALRQANVLRLAIVNGLLHHIITEVDPEQKTMFRADGSVDLTSDYDVTVIGEKKEDAAVRFNNTFEAMFGRASADIFDSNLYGSSPMDEVPNVQSSQCKGHFSCSSTCEQKSDRCLLVSQLRFRYSAGVVQNQHAWALATILRNITDVEEQWLRNEISTNPHVSKHLKRLFAQAFKLFTENPLSTDVQEANKKYGEVLKNIYDLRLAGLKDSNTQEFAIRFANAESLGGWYAQAAYVTIGPFIQIVGNDQRKLDMSISQDEYKDSFIENFSYLLHALELRASCSQGFVLGAKYIARGAFAAKQVFETSEEDIVKELQSLMEQSLQVRKQREQLLSRAEAAEHVEESMLKHMKGVTCGSKGQTDISRLEVLKWIFSHLMLMF